MIIWHIWDQPAPVTLYILCLILLLRSALFLCHFTVRHSLIAFLFLIANTDTRYHHQINGRGDLWIHCIGPRTHTHTHTRPKENFISFYHHFYSIATNWAWIFPWMIKMFSFIFSFLVLTALRWLLCLLHNNRWMTHRMTREKRKKSNRMPFVRIIKHSKTSIGHTKIEIPMVRCRHTDTQNNPFAKSPPNQSIADIRCQS